MQHLFVLSELFVRIIPMCALLGSLFVFNDKLKLKTLLLGQVAAVTCAVAGLAMFLATQPLSNAQPTVMLSGFIRFDFLASVMALSISVITMIVTWFSERNLLSDNTRLAFIQYLMALSLSASILVASNDLILFFACWSAISVLLWRVVALKDVATKSARSVLYHHLFSDLCFFLAVIVITTACHTADIPSILARLGELQGDFSIYGWSVPLASSTVVALLLVLAMVSKSALFPFHNWLLATVDAPTPLSGLLHAGIVNVSAVMAARMYPVLTQSTPVHVLWILWAAGAAFIGTLCMSTRSDTKGELVFSTVGQMGFMSLECAVGAIPAAIFHLIAHGFFKCTLFLQAHSSISEGQTKMRFGHGYGGVSKYQSNIHLALLCLLSLPVFIWLCMQPSVDSTASLSVLVAMAALITSVEAFRRIGLALLLTTGVVFLTAVMLAGDLSKFSADYMGVTSAHGAWILVAIIVAFGVATFWLSQVRESSVGRTLWVHSLNGLYLDDLIYFVKSRSRRLAQTSSRKGNSHARRKVVAK